VMSRPLVSIILPTYNREVLLRRALESVLAQTYDLWELLVVDDGSTDGTRAYLQTLTDTRVRPILREHCGNAGAVRNAGCRTARGSYLAFLDSDDQWLPEKLALQIADLHAHPECGWGYASFWYMDTQGRQTAQPRDWQAYGGWILERVIDRRALIVTPAVIVERHVFETVAGFRESLPRCEDYDLWIRLAEASPATVVSIPLVNVRQHFDDRDWRWLDVLGYMQQIYDGLVTRTASSRIRLLCRVQQARLSLDIVGRMRGAGQYEDARRALRTSFRYAGWHPAWWTAVLKTWLRPVTPEPLRSLYSRPKT